MSELSINDIKGMLQGAGYKLTSQREATVAILLEKEDDHLSAEEVYVYVKKRYPEIGLATVYRTLEILTDLNITKKVMFDDGLARYDLRKNRNAHFHHHLLCLTCGNIEEITEDLLDDVEHIVENKYGFKVLDHRLTFHGTCQMCQKRTKGEKS